MLTVVESGPRQITWHFNLTGSNITKAPREVVAAQSGGGEIGMKSVESLSVKTKLAKRKTELDYPQTVLVKATLNLPKAGQNKFNFDVQIEGIIHIGSRVDTEYVNAEKASSMGPLRIDFINLEKMRVYITSINDSAIRGPLADGFLAGANYILESGDRILSSWFDQFINLERIY